MRIGCFYILWYVLLPILCIWKAKVNHKGFFRDNLDKEQCNAIKGISIYLVLTGHMLGYIANFRQWNPSLLPNRLFNFIDVFFIGQLMVVMFMFYTGFGMMESFKKKGDNYIRSFPWNRILKVLLNFDVAVLAYLVLSLVIGAKVSVGKVSLALLGWASLGNSNWYICVILLCYVLFWLSFHPRMPWKRQKAQLAVFSVLILLLAVWLSYARAGKEWWWNKLLVVPFGVFVSMYREKLRVFTDRNYRAIVYVTLTLLGVHYAFFLLLRTLHISWPSPNGGVAFNLRSLIFATTVVLATRKIKIGNPVLAWLGANLFPIYIYQRIPMLGLHVAFGDEFLYDHVPFYCLACIGITLTIAWLYRFFEIRHVPQWHCGKMSKGMV